MTVLHVDMDAFFASVEQRDHPEWRGKPVIVGSGPHERGVVSTCSYEARRYGVHSAMPSRTAYQLCPHAIFTPGRHEVYSEVSAQVFEILEHYTPYVEGVSIDEAFLDISGSIHLFGDAKTLGERLRAEIREKCGLACSVGIAPNRLLAKLGSEAAKPDGLFVMPFEQAEIERYLADKPVGVLWGAGKRTVEILGRYGYRTCGDLQRANLGSLRRILGDAAAESLHSHAFGIDHSEIRYEEEGEKSVSREYTFPEDCSDRAQVRAQLLELIEEVGMRFRRERRWAHTAKLKLRDGKFNTVTRQAKFKLAARDDISFRHLALAIFDREWPEDAERTLRLIGFGVTDIVEEPDLEELTLFPTGNEDLRAKREALSAAWDRIREGKKKSQS